jgi:hypothetical protein
MKKKMKRRIRRRLLIAVAIVPAIAVGWNAIKNKFSTKGESAKGQLSKRELSVNEHLALS